MNEGRGVIGIIKDSCPIHTKKKKTEKENFWSNETVVTSGGGEGALRPFGDREESMRGHGRAEPAPTRS